MTATSVLAHELRTGDHVSLGIGEAVVVDHAAADDAIRLTVWSPIALEMCELTLPSEALVTVRR